MNSYEALTRRLLATADVAIDGPQLHDITVRNPAFYRRAVLGGNLGLGESYMDGWWDCRALDELIARVLAADVGRDIGKAGLLLPRMLFWLPQLPSIFPQLRRRLGSSGRSTEQHYEAGNELYERMLDRRMTYSCAYYADATTLDDAQEAKLEMCCRKLGLRRGHRLLDVGCGWGALAKYAAERYDVSVVGVTISPQQLALGRERCKGLPIDIRLLDYHRIEGEFDRAVSLGMFEHVGHRHYRDYLKIVHRSLTRDGLFLLETIGSNRSVRSSDAWFAKYIWNSPTSMFPSIAQIGRAAEPLFVVEDLHNFGADYDRTLGAWGDRIDALEDWIVGNYDRRFYRMWRYYLRSCQGGFRSRSYQMWQILLAKSGVPGGYRPARPV